MPFFNLQFTLPDPTNSATCDLSDYIKFLTDKLQISHSDENSNQYLMGLIKHMAKVSKASLRDIQHVFIMLDYFYNKSKDKYEYVLLTFLVFLKIKTDPLFYCILSKDPVNESNKSLELYEKYSRNNPLLTKILESYDKRLKTISDPYTRIFSIQIGEAIDNKCFTINRGDFKDLSSIEKICQHHAEKIEYLFDAVSENTDMDSIDGFTKTEEQETD